MKHDTALSHKRARAWHLSGQIRTAASAYRSGQLSEAEFRRIWRQATYEFGVLFGDADRMR